MDKNDNLCDQSGKRKVEMRFKQLSEVAVVVKDLDKATRLLWG